MSGVLAAMPAIGSGGPFIFTPATSSYTNGINIRQAAIAAGWDGVRPLIATISMSGYCGPVETGYPFPPGSTLALNGNGNADIRGGHGGGGDGGWTSGTTNVAGRDGWPGGPALKADFAITVSGVAAMRGGGGGGGGGAATNYFDSWPPSAYNTYNVGGSGGGNGAGAPEGVGSPAGWYGFGDMVGVGQVRGNSGVVSYGAATAGGAAVAASEASYPPAYVSTGGKGGNGGDYGMAGSPGNSATVLYLGNPVAGSPYTNYGAGGAAGKAVEGNGYVTWIGALPIFIGART